MPEAVKGLADEQLDEILQALYRMRDGDFSVRLRKRGNGTIREIASVFNEIPGPLEPVTATFPPYPEPIAIDIDAISSSHCTNVPPYLGNSRRSNSMMSDHGVIG